MKVANRLPRILQLIVFCTIIWGVSPLLSVRYYGNLQAVELVRVLASKSHEHSLPWALSASSPDPTIENMVCRYDDFRAGLLCGLTYLLHTPSRAYEQLSLFAKEGADDPLFRYYWGAALYADDDQAAIDIWRMVPQLATYFARQGVSLYTQQRPDEALLLWEISEQIDPAPSYRKAEMYLNLCAIHEQRGEVAEALYWCHQAEISDSKWWTLIIVAQHYLALDEPARALAIANDLLSRPVLSTRAEAMAHRMRARVYIGRGEYQNALTEYMWIQRLGAADNGMLFETGDLYFRMQDYHKARDVFEEVITLDRNGSLTQRAEDYLSQIDTLLGD